MSVETDPVPPVPEHTPPLQEDAAKNEAGKSFNHTWTRWFTSVRAKINVINESLVNLGDIGGNGILVKLGALWSTEPVERLIPSGGTATQVLAKVNNSNYQVGWIDQTSGGGIDPATQTDEFHELFRYNDIFSVINSGSSSISQTPVEGHPGVVFYTTSTSTAASCGIIRSTNANISYTNLTLGGGELRFDTLIYVHDLFEGANTGQLRVGFMDEISGAPTNGVHAQYTSGNPYWEIWNRDGGSSSSVTGSILVSTGWHLVTIVVNAAGTEASLYINSMIAATISSGFPSAGFSYGTQVQKSGGTTPFRLSTDFIRVRQTFTSSRY